MYTLFFSPGACSLAAHIAIIDSGLSYQLRRLKFAENEQQSAEYLKVNPKGRVPALVTDRGTLTETTAILLFLAQMAPEKTLAPLDDPFALAKLQGFNSYLSSTVHVNHAHGRRATRWADDPTAIEAMKRKVPETMRAAYRLIEDDMLSSPFVMGETYSIADPYLFVMSSWLKGDGVEMAEFPRVKAHYERMQERASVQKALADEAAA